MKIKELNNKFDYEDLSIREMSDEQFSKFLQWKTEVVNRDMGCTPDEACLVGMWEMWKHIHRPITDDDLDEITDISLDEGHEHARIYGHDNELRDEEIFCQGFKHGMIYSRQEKYIIYEEE